MTKKRTEYSESFKAEAIIKVKENQGNISQTAKELGIPMNTLANWQRKDNGGQLKGTDSYNPELMAALDDIDCCPCDLYVFGRFKSDFL